MKKQKITYQTEEQNEMIKFLIVLGIVIILILGVFFLSKVLIKDGANELTYQTGTVSTNIAIVGTILNQPEKEYYVLAYDTESNNASAYVTYAEYYKEQMKEKNGLTIYHLDLNSVFNKSYYVTENSNPKATKISDLKLKDGTLIKVKNGKISEYVEGMDKIASKLKVN